MDKITTVYEGTFKELWKLHRKIERFNSSMYSKIGDLFEPIMKNIDKYTEEELKQIIEAMPPIHFYRAEIRGYMKTKFGKTKG